MKHKEAVDAMLKVLGGKDNISSYENCATRMRIVLKDDSVVDKEAAEAVPESQGYFYSTGQHQFIFGTGKVNEVYDDFNQEMEGTAAAGSDSDVKQDAYANLNPAQKLVRVLADILVPLIPALVTTGLLMGLRGLFVELGMTMSPGVETLFGMLTDTAFAFLPVLIAYSATRKFGGNPIIGIVVGLMMVAPQLPNAYEVLGGDAAPLSIFGLDVYGFQGSIFPAIIAGWLISRLEKWFRTWVPHVMDLIVTPFLSLTVTVAIIFFILGPIIQVIESTVINALVSMISAPFGIGYVLYAGLQQLLVVTGLHHSLGIIELSLLSDNGVNMLNPLGTASMAGQFGAAIGAAFLVKDKVRRTNMISAAVPTLFGITEPLIFGVNLRSMRIFASGMVGGAVGGLLTYIFNLAATGMGITFIPGLLLYIGDMSGMLQYVIVIIASAAVGLILVQTQRKHILEEI